MDKTSMLLSRARAENERLEENMKQYKLEIEQLKEKLEEAEDIITMYESHREGINTIALYTKHEESSKMAKSNLRRQDARHFPSMKSNADVCIECKDVSRPVEFVNKNKFHKKYCAECAERFL